MGQFILNIFMAIWILGTLFMPHIIGVILSAIVILLVRKKIIEKDSKIPIYVIIVVFCMTVSIKVGYPVMAYLSKKPDKIYTEMKKINESEKLMGLSKGEVITQLGEPERKNSNDNVYTYNAGEITSYVGFGGHTYYKLYVEFDENSKVKSTSISIYYPPGG